MDFSFFGTPVKQLQQRFHGAGGFHGLHGFWFGGIQLRPFGDGGVRLSLLWLLVIIPMLGQGHGGRGFPHEPAGFPLAAWAWKASQGLRFKV
jgi:hypothetical protein